MRDEDYLEPRHEDGDVFPKYRHFAGCAQTYIRRATAKSGIVPPNSSRYIPKGKGLLKAHHTLTLWLVQLHNK